MKKIYDWLRAHEYVCFWIAGMLIALAEIVAVFSITHPHFNAEDMGHRTKRIM
ncbi:MAG: hypothetical protein IJ553_04740 [Alloprevotella sp.]|nr:hypothetical protein [Alloprevotella sp.]